MGSSDCLTIADELLFSNNGFLRRNTSWDAYTRAQWLEEGCKCVYCGKDMMESYDTAYRGSCRDHLLPVKIYEELANEPWNRVLSCVTCNGFKGVFDPNEKAKVYVKGSRQPITRSQRLDLMKIAQEYVQSERAVREAIFKKEKELIVQRLQTLSDAQSTRP